MKDAAFRLAFIAACSGYVLGLVLLAGWQGVAVAFLAGVVGVVLAVALAQEWTEQPAASAPRPSTRRMRRVPRPSAEE